MTQTPNGTMLFGWFNQSTMNNAGTLDLTSGGSEPSTLAAPALSGLPASLLRNWGGNNLNVSNTSPNANTPIWVCAYGPGMPGQTPSALTSNGVLLSLITGQSAQGPTKPQAMQLVLSSASPALAIFAIIGGPPDAQGGNGFLVAVNASSNTGPGTGPPPPPGYYATTTNTSYSFNFNWKGATIYVVNMSPVTTTNAGVRLIAL